MRLIDADTLNYVRVRIYHDDGTIGGYNAVVPSSEIKNAPTVDAALQWIPCSERLPGFPSKSLWVNSKGEPSLPRSWRPMTQDDGPWQDGYIVCSKSGKVFYSTWYACDKKSEPHWTTKAEVIAWIPLPKPYEAERKEDEIDEWLLNHYEVGNEHQNKVIDELVSLYRAERKE